MQKRKSLLTFAIAALTVLSSCTEAPEHKTSLDQNKPESKGSSDQEIGKISEALGHYIGRNLNTPAISFDVDSLVKGIKDGAAGKPSPMSEKEYEQALGQLQQQALTKMAVTNLDAANEFLKKNAGEKGVVELVPGKLQYTIIAEGKGPAVAENSSPEIIYTGKYLDGSVFGSSESSGGSITVPLDQTIPGFSKGITGMKEGEKRRLFVHPDLGYGTSGQMLPNSLLIFDVEVVKAASPKTETETKAPQDKPAEPKK